MPQGVIAVELVAMPAPGAARQGRAPAPKLAPPAPPPPPEPKQVVLPKEPAPLPEPKPRPSRSRRPKPKPAPEPEPKPPSRRREKDYSDVLSELREEVGDESPVRRRRRRAQTASIGSPTGSPVPPEVLAWMRRARIHIRQNWVVPPGFRNAAAANHDRGRARRQRRGRRRARAS